MLSSFLIPFLSIASAEFLDKSQLMVILLAARTKHHLQLFLGILIAFILVDRSAIIAGVWLAGLIPSFYIKLIAGLGFILFGIINLKESAREEQKQIVIKNPFLSGLGLIFLAEWGDKTQIASGLFAARFSPLLVFLGVILALSILSLIAIYLGKFISKKFERQHIRKVSGIIFLLVGLIILIS